MFRVYLYTPPSWSAAEWELTGADITDVLAWADADTPTGGVAEVSVVVRLTRLRSSAKSGCAATTRTQAILLAVRWAVQARSRADEPRPAALSPRQADASGQCADGLEDDIPVRQRSLTGVCPRFA